MINASSFKSIPLAAAVAAALLMGSAVHAQGAGSSGAGTSDVQNGAAPAPGTAGTEPVANKTAMAKPMKAKKTKHKAVRPAKRAMQQPMTGTGPTEDPARIKP